MKDESKAMNGISQKSVIERQESSLRRMSPEMLDTAEETIIDYITCPHCKDYIQPPSFCCENGHFVCYGCREQISKCPSCGIENYPNKNNTIFDMILKELYYPCFYQANGCSAYFKYDELKEHQANCKFKLEPCAFWPAGCSLVFKSSEKGAHEAVCEYGVSCRIYAKIRGAVCTSCTWRGTKNQLQEHITKTHQLAWYPHQIESDVPLSMVLAMNFDFEKTELVFLKNLNEMFYLYSKTVANSQHFVAVQYVGSKTNWKNFMYSVEFVYETKKVGFEDVVLPYTVTEENIYKANNCFYVHYDFLKKHFLAERAIDCYVKIFRKEEKIVDEKKIATDSNKVTIKE